MSRFVWPPISSRLDRVVPSAGLPLEPRGDVEPTNVAPETAVDEVLDRGSDLALDGEEPMDASWADATAAEEEAALPPFAIEQVGRDVWTRIAIHDLTRFQWTVALPLPEATPLDYAIEVEFDLPTSAVAYRSPWEQLQARSRLDGPVGAAISQEASVDALRRGAVTLAELLQHASEGFARHCRDVRPDGRAPDGQAPLRFLSLWLDAALLRVEETRGSLVREGQDDSPLLARERALIDEFVSVRLLDTLARCERALGKLEAREPGPDVAAAGATLRARVAQVLRGEIAYRHAHGFVVADASAPAALEAYVARASQLKKHFEAVLFLERESRALDERVRQWMTSVAALLAGTAAFVLQLVLSRAFQIGSGVVLVALVAGLMYAMRDRLKEYGRAWLTGRVYRFHAQRVVRCRLPARNDARRAPIVDAREWCTQSLRAEPDPLNPEVGASMPVTTVQYLHRGRVRPEPGLGRAGVQGVRHLFRYDLSPLLPRLDNATKRVPVVDPETGVPRFVDAPRRYRIPVRLRVAVQDHEYTSQATLVLDKRGLQRLDKAV